MLVNIISTPPNAMLIVIGVHRVGLVAALHPPLVSHPPFNFAPGCRIWCKKIVLTSLHPNDTPPYLMNNINLIVVALA